MSGSMGCKSFVKESILENFQAELCEVLGGKERIKKENVIMLKQVHHIAIICSDYDLSKEFYVEKLGMQIIREVYRAERQSYKLDLAINGEYIIELFSFPDPPARPTRPESTGLRHLAFQVDDIDRCIVELKTKGIQTEPIRIDEYTNRRFTFFSDPDDLPIELYEV